MKLNKVIALLCSTGMAAALLAGCATNTTSQTSSIQSESIAAVEPVDVEVMALKGPTAMGMVEFMDESDNGKIEENNYTFNIVAAPDEVSGALAKGDTDIAAVPANLASVLYNNTDGNVEVLAINTLGVLYIVENGDAIHSVEDLKGKTIYASGKGSTPEYALNYILEQNGIDPETDVNIEWKSEHTECLAALMADENGVALLPQPFVTTAQTKNENIRTALDLSEEWDKLQENCEDPSSLITGVVVARKDFIDENPAVIQDFLEHYKESVDFVNSDVDAAAALVDAYDIVPEAIAKKAIPECNIVFIDGTDMKDQLSGYLEVLNAQNPKSIGGTLPNEDFYYVASTN